DMFHKRLLQTRRGIRGPGRGHQDGRGDSAPGGALPATCLARSHIWRWPHRYSVNNWDRNGTCPRATGARWTTDRAGWLGARLRSPAVAPVPPCQQAFALQQHVEGSADVAQASAGRLLPRDQYNVIAGWQTAQACSRGLAQQPFDTV